MSKRCRRGTAPTRIRSSHWPTEYTWASDRYHSEHDNYNPLTLERIVVVPRPRPGRPSADALRARICDRARYWGQLIRARHHPDGNVPDDDALPIAATWRAAFCRAYHISLRDSAHGRAYAVAFCDGFWGPVRADL